MDMKIKDPAEEICVDCGHKIYTNEGRYRHFGLVYCEGCGDKHIEPSGLIL